MTKQSTAVIDRISEEKHVVILAEEIGKEFILQKDELDFTPREGLWLNIHVEGDEITSIQPNESLTEEKSKAVSDVMARLKKRKNSKFK